MKVRDLIKYLVDCGLDLNIRFLTQSGWTDFEKIHIGKGDGTLIIDNSEVRRLKREDTRKTTQLQNWAWRINRQHARIMELESEIMGLRAKNNILIQLLNTVEQLENGLFGAHEDNAEMARPLSIDSSFDQ